MLTTTTEKENTMVEQIFHTPSSARNKDNTGITFGKDVPRRGTVTDTLAKAYGVTIPKREIAADADERIAAFEALAAKYPPTLDLNKMVRNDPIDTWEKQVNDYNKQASASRLIHSNYANIIRDFRRAKRENLNDVEQYDWIMQHLPIDEVVENFTDAATTLGTAVTDPDEALAASPEAALALRTEGAKLKALGTLRAVLDREDPERDLQFAALFTELQELPRLAGYTMHHRFVPLHSPEEEAEHTRVKYDLEFSTTYPDGYITLLAMGKIPNLELSIAASVDEWEDRIAKLANVGNIETVAAPKGGRHPVDISAGPLGTTITPA